MLSLIALGRRAEAEAYIREIEKTYAAGAYIAPELIARGWAALGERERALDWLEKGVEVQSAFFMWIDVYPEFRGFRGDPRFERLRSHIKWN